MSPVDDLQCFFDRGDFEPRFVTKYGIKKFKTLLAKASDPDVSEGDGRTALFFAARAGRHEHLLALLEAKADPNCSDATDEAPLQVASRYGFLDCVRSLLAAGADVNHLPSPRKTKYAETALCSAIRKVRGDVVCALLDAGADPNLFAKGDFLNAPLLSAACQGHAAFCELLLSKGANPNLHPGKQRIPLHDAIREGHVEVVKLLLKHGANPNSKDDNGDTPLMVALTAEGNSKDPMPMLFALLTANVELNLKNKLGETALDLAIQWRLTEAAELLRTSGALESVTEDDNGGEEIAPGIFSGVKLVSRVYHPPSKADEELVSKLLSTSPKIITGSGWEASPKHWTILDFADEPTPLDRMAYVARGCCNAPKGRELADGPKHLGESYRSAAERFVSLGYFEKLRVTEAAIRNATTEEVQKALKRLGQRVGGNKSELFRRLESIAPAEVDAIGRRKDWYIRTEKGAAAVKALTKGKPRYEWKVNRPELFDLIFDAFRNRNLEAGLLAYLEWQSSQGDTRHLTSPTVRDLRELLNNPIPTDMDFASRDEGAIRAGAAIVFLLGSSAHDHGLDDWKRWGVQTSPRWLEDEMNEETTHSPSQFAFWTLHPQE